MTSPLLAPRETIRAVLEGGDVGELAGPDGSLPPALEAARNAAQGALCWMRLERGGREGAVWAAPGFAALAVPREGLWQLSAIPVGYLPDALARLNDLGPRPRIEPAATVSLDPGELATALATRSTTEPALQPTLDGLREHWRIESRWQPAEGSAGIRTLEVIDSDAGMWLVIPTDPTVELWPTTPTMVFRLIAGLLPRDDEHTGGVR